MLPESLGEGQILYTNKRDLREACQLRESYLASVDLFE